MERVLKPAENLPRGGHVLVKKNPDKVSDNDPAFVLAGVIYSISDNFDVDLGVKTELSSSETDLSVMAGVVKRF